MTRVFARALACVLLLGFGLTNATPAPAAKKDTPKTAAKRSAGKAPAAQVEKVPLPEEIFGRDLPDPAGPGTVPDDYVMIRVADRKLTARDFVSEYFASGISVRPGRDSLGRVSFMKVLVTKELLALEARRLDLPLSFEDRLTLRDHSQRAYSNALYQRLVLDPVRVTDEEVLDAYQLFSVEVRVRHILLASREAAERLRRELIAARIGWSLAVRRHSLDDRENDGDIGWQPAPQMGLALATTTHRLKPGEISLPVRSRDGWSLFQCVERREVKPPAFEAMRKLVRGQLETMKSNLLANALQDSLADQMGIEVDSTNVRWAASHFQASTSMEEGAGTPTVTINAAVPEFTAEDTSRVLARFRGGRLTLGGFLHDYSMLPPVMRPSVNDFGALRNQVIATATTPRIGELALERGMDKDPMAMAMVDRKREQLQVERLYADSVDYHVRVEPGAHRRFYEENRHKFFTDTEVRYAAITRPSRAGMDSVAARIRAGESPVAILREDSLSGHVSGSVQIRRQSEQGTAYYRVLMEELRPGQFWIGGPDKAGDYILIHVLSRDEGRQMAFEEVEATVDEALRSEHSERLLDMFLVRLSRRYPVSWRPDLVMRTDFRRPL